MRPKIVIVILLAGIVGVTVIFFFKPPSGRPQTAVVPIAQAQLAGNEPVAPKDSPAVIKKVTQNFRNNRTNTRLMKIKLPKFGK